MQSSLNKELEDAVSKNNLEKVKALLSAGADANHRIKVPHDNPTLLHLTGNVKIAKELLLGGAKIDTLNDNSETPLYFAIKENRGIEFVRELLKHGADVNIINRTGNTALSHAVKKCNNLEEVKELLEFGADINIRSLKNAVFRESACPKLLIKYALIKNFEYYVKVVKSSLDKRYNYNELSKYLEDCVCEILQMKTDEIKDNLSLYEIVTININVNELCKNQLCVKLSKIDFSLRYPIYNDIILNNINPFLKRADLLSKIQFYTKLDTTNQNVEEKKIILDHDSAYNITEFLSTEDLENFIEAFDLSNKPTFESLSALNNLIEPSTSQFETSIFSDAKRPRLE